MKKFGFVAAVAFGLGMLASAGTAAADGLGVSPPAIIDGTASRKRPTQGLSTSC